MKIYIIMETDNCDGSWAVGAFNDKEKAEKYCDLQNQLEDFNSFYVSDVDLLDDYIFREVKPYYSYYIGKEELNDFDDAIRFDYWEIREWLIEHGYINEKELEEIEANDTSLNEVGNPAHLKCGKYIKSHISEDVMKELLEFDNTPEMRWMNDNEPHNRLYDEDLHIDETENMIEVFSINSFEEAKEKALVLYEDWKNRNEL